MASLKQYQFIETLLLRKGIDQSDTPRLNQVGIQDMESIYGMTNSEVANAIKNLKRLKTIYNAGRKPQHQDKDLKQILK